MTRKQIIRSLVEALFDIPFGTGELTLIQRLTVGNRIKVIGMGIENNAKTEQELLNEGVEI